MKKVLCFNSIIENAVITNRDKEVLTDYRGTFFQDHNVAPNIIDMRIMFEHSGNRQGDKTAICGCNSTICACVFGVATMTLNVALMPSFDETFYLPDTLLALSRSERLTVTYNHQDVFYGRISSKNSNQKHVRYYENQAKDLVMINNIDDIAVFSEGMIEHNSIKANDFLSSSYTFCGFKFHDRKFIKSPERPVKRC